MISDRMRTAGFTLLEVIVALGLSVGVAGMLYSLLSAAWRSYLKEVSAAELLQAGSLALERMAHDVEEARGIERPPNEYAGVPNSRMHSGSRVGVRAFIETAGPFVADQLYRPGDLIEFSGRSNGKRGEEERFDLVRQV